MTSVRVPIIFRSEWIKQNDHYKFNGTYKVVALNMHEFIVINVDHDGHANILDKTCNYREFELDQLSCEHALAASRY